MVVCDVGGLHSKQAVPPSTQVQFQLLVGGFFGPHSTMSKSRLTIVLDLSPLEASWLR